MGNRRSVMVYGDSLIISGIAASLENKPHITVHQIRVQASTDGRDRDLADRITRVNPELLLVGVAPDTGYMLHLTGHETQALTLHGLVQTIRHRSTHTRFPGGAGRPLDRLTALHVPARTKRMVLVLAFLSLSGLLLALYMRFDSETQLVGVAFDFAPPPGTWLAFIGGIVLGGVLIGAWRHWGKGRKMH